jgi:hypothetical protein
VAFIEEKEEDSCNLIYISNKRVEQLIQKYTSFEVIPHEELLKELTFETLTLNNSEIEQIKYWKPQTIGEVIFNYWD